MGPLEDREVAEFEGVRAIKENELKLLCRINGKEHWVPHDKIDEASGVRKYGDRGRLVVDMRWVETAAIEI